MQLGPSFSSKSWSCCVFFLLPSLSLGPIFGVWAAGSTHITQLPWHLLGLFHIRGVWQRGEFCFPFIVPLFVDNLKGWKKETFIWAFQLCSHHINERSSAHRNSLICVLPGNNCKIHWNLQGELKSPVEEFCVSKYQQVPAPPTPDFSYHSFRGTFADPQEWPGLGGHPESFCIWGDTRGLFTDLNYLILS